MELVDVTIREGHQRPGRGYSVDQKLAAVRALDALGVDAIQVGFPAADDGTAAVCADSDVDAALTGIARAVPGDVEAAVAAGVDVVEVFAPTSERQRTHLLGLSLDDVASRAAEATDLATDAGVAVTFTAMDGFRTPREDLNRLLAALPVSAVNVADTVGIRLPHEVEAFLPKLDGDLGSVGVHFHDDLGVATANAIAAARCGVGRIDVSVGGVGERAGNTPLETVVVAAELAGIETRVETEAIIPRCREVLDHLDEPVPASRPVIGRAAFTHEAGLHTAAMLDDPATLEAFDPARFGGERQLRFGPQTGRGAARRLLERAGECPTDDAVSRLVSALADLEEPIALDAAIALAAEVAVR